MQSWLFDLQCMHACTLAAALVDLTAPAAAAAVCVCAAQAEEEPIVVGLRYMDPQQEAAAAERGACTAAAQAQQHSRAAQYAVWHQACR
jgi:hypothetical protein